MISLRGYLRKVKNDPKSKTSNSRNKEKSKNKSKDKGHSGEETHSGEWEWVGVWSWKTLTDEDLVYLNPSTSRNNNSSGSSGGGERNSKHVSRIDRNHQNPRPFRYKFHLPQSAHLVEVPKVPVYERNDEVKDTQKEKKLDEIDNKNDSIDKLATNNKVSESENNKVSGNNSKDETLVEQNKNEKDLNTKSEKKETSSSIDNDKKTSNGLEQKSKTKNSFQQQNETYGSNGYTDAGLMKPDICPQGGSWNGYFENVSKRKDRNSSRVQETFYLFFNHTPKPNASITFVDDNDSNDIENTTETDNKNTNSTTSTTENNPNDENTKKDLPSEDRKVTFSSPKENENKLPPNHIHVQGKGSNQFGIFQIVGSLNIATSILHCHRIYINAIPIVSSQVPGSISNQNKKKTSDSLTPTRIITRVRSRSMRLDDMDTGGYGVTSMSFSSNYFGNQTNNTGEAKKHFTRKKRMSWQKSDSNLDSVQESNVDASSAASSQNTTQTSQTKKHYEKGLGGNSPNNFMNKTNRKRGRSQSEGIAFSDSSILISKNKTNHTNISISTDNSINTQIAQTPADNTTSSITNHTSNKKTKSSKGSSVVTPSKKSKMSSSNSHVQVLTLPKAGNPADARWRAAHYIFYQVTENPNTDGTGVGNSSNGSPSNTNVNNKNPSNNNGNFNNTEPYSYCVYEGEMNKGNQQRDGMGICLYPSKNIYQGHFRKNKEHGFGMLLTGDRKVCIYKGQWERGRMHGQGRYYYQSTGGIYEGEFKENARHGVGVYKLADGGVYEGDWRENEQSGRGSFTWKDGSTYIGLWKNGKRHGQGLLTTSDGFSYDGMWNANAMEGRGIAIYPDGQRYEGLWSKGKKEGRGTVRFTNGAVYEGRFKEDRMEGQGTMKLMGNVLIPREIKQKDEVDNDNEKSNEVEEDEKEEDMDWMIPIQFQRDLGHIHQRAGFTKGGE